MTSPIPATSLDPFRDRLAAEVYSILCQFDPERESRRELSKLIVDFLLSEVREAYRGTRIA